jgi:hypothetical protein
MSFAPLFGEHSDTEAASKSLNHGYDNAKSQEKTRQRRGDVDHGGGTPHFAQMEAIEAMMESEDDMAAKYRRAALERLRQMKQARRAEARQANAMRAYLQAAQRRHVHAHRDDGVHVHMEDAHVNDEDRHHHAADPRYIRTDRRRQTDMRREHSHVPWLMRGRGYDHDEPRSRHVRAPVSMDAGGLGVPGGVPVVMTLADTREDKVRRRYV